MHTTCTRCGRKLTKSVGMGPVCARRARAEAATLDAKPDTIAKALEDLEDGAIVDTRRVTSSGRRIFAVLSSTGTGTYLSTAAACTCKAGHAGRVCRHTAAARLIAA